MGGKRAAKSLQVSNVGIFHAQSFVRRIVWSRASDSVAASPPNLAS